MLLTNREKKLILITFCFAFGFALLILVYPLTVFLIISLIAKNKIIKSNNESSGIAAKRVAKTM